MRKWESGDRLSRGALSVGKLRTRNGRILTSARRCGEEGEPRQGGEHTTGGGRPEPSTGRERSPFERTSRPRSRLRVGSARSWTAPVLRRFRSGAALVDRKDGRWRIPKTEMSHYGPPVHLRCRTLNSTVATYGVIVRCLGKLGLLAVLAGLVSWPAAADLTRTNLFIAGEGGYALYRIPAVVVTPAGSLLVACEARTRRDSDWSQTDLLFRRSEDQGRTWSAAAPVVSLPASVTRNPVALAHQLGQPDERTLHNPVWIAARDGTVHLIFGAEYNRVFHSRSRDDGRSFEPPRELTTVGDRFRPEYDWKVVATGPGHGLQLSPGRPGRPHPHAGRLLVPIWLSTGTGGHGHRPSAISTLFSDDGGETWERGDLIANDPDPLANPSEATLVELSDGRVMLNIRNESPAHRRAVALSADGATGWSRPEFVEALFEPVCAASLVRWPGDPREHAATLLFSHPNSEPPAGTTNASRSVRRNLTLKLSADDGQTWPVQRVLDPGPSAYSDLAAGPDGALWCFYESWPDKTPPYGALTLARFDLDWVFGEDMRTDDEGFVSLFNGRDLDDWVNVNCAPETWTATNGVIHCTGVPIGELRTRRMYQNFILELEWRHLRPGGNAGVFVWADALTARGQPFHRGVEVQVLDGREGEGHTSDGDVFPIHGARMTPLNGRGGDRAFPLTRRSQPSPEWNHYRITCVDGVLTHAVNGVVVTRGVNCSPRKGYICLESEGSPVEFRNLRLRELPATVALSPADIADFDEAFHSLYTGTDLRGWITSPALHQWKANDWTLEHSGQRNGDDLLWTEAEWGDFELIVDWRRNVRTAEAASPSTPAVLLRGDPNQRVELVGSAGEGWNRARLTLRGEHLRVEINGKVVEEEQVRTGIRPRGRLGLAPADSPHQFANLFVRRLD